jgi:hypothetical protein
MTARATRGSRDEQDDMPRQPSGRRSARLRERVMPASFANLEPWIFLALFLGMLALMGYRVWRGVQALRAEGRSIQPKVPADALFGESGASGNSERSLVTRLRRLLATRPVMSRSSSGCSSWCCPAFIEMSCRTRHPKNGKRRSNRVHEFIASILPAATSAFRSDNCLLSTKFLSQCRSVAIPPLCT